MITYIYLKDSTLMAFEGPEKPEIMAHWSEDYYRHIMKRWEYEMNAPRKSALPVVNITEVAYMEKGRWRRLGGPSWIEPGEPVALPGWGLENTYQLCPSGNWNECSKEQYERERNGSLARQAYRLKRSETVKKEPINLTFYYWKLWHSDKPFPVREHFHSLSFEDNQKLYLNHIKENWLSTAYEVVNPEVIPGIKRLEKGGFMRFLKDMVDCDQITLPDGYGIDRKDVGSKIRVHVESGPMKGNHSRPSHRIATITLPENPDNSAHGDKLKEHIEDTLYSTGRFRPEEASDLTQEILKGVEPSESQEETLEAWIEKERNVLQNLGGMMWTDPEMQEKSLLVARAMTTTLDYIREARKKGMIK